MRAKKSLGQHFLRSKRALDVIIEAGNIMKNDIVLEIGPGEGILTERLLKTGAKVVAAEKDDDLYEFLKTKFHKEIKKRKLILMHEDILDFDFKKLTAKSYKLIANIPYNITGAILKKFLSAEHQPKQMVLLVQKEVAKRIVEEKSSILSTSVKVYGKPRYVETVKASSFTPMPKVDSAIIAIDDISKDFFKSFDEKEFFEMLRTGFRSKRKKLSSNLSAIFNKDTMRKTFQELGLNDNLRAEDMNPETWRRLAESLLLER